MAWDDLQGTGSDITYSEWNTMVSYIKSVISAGSTIGSFAFTDGLGSHSILDGAEPNNISDANATDLTDSGDSTLHYHATDRNRSNHTGSQTASTISDFDTEVSNNTDVTANTGSRHNHTNKAILDLTTGSFTTAQETKLNGIENNADVTDATNVDAAGAVMNSDTSTVSMSFVIDEDNMASNLATKVPTQQSVKAYVDTQVGSAGGVSTSGTPVGSDYARFVDASTIEGRSSSEVKTDLGYMTDLVDDTTPKLSGNLDTSGSALVSIETAGEALGSFQTCYLGADGKYYKTDANAESTSSGRILYTLTDVGSNVTGSFARFGIVPALGLTAGSAYYLSETAGLITATAPTTSTSIVRGIGYAKSATVLEFVPDETYIEVA